MCRPLTASICWRTNPGLRFPGNPYVPHCFQMFTNPKLIWVRQGYKDIWIMTRTTIMTFIPIVGFLRDSVGKESACNARSTCVGLRYGRSTTYACLFSPPASLTSLLCFSPLRPASNNRVEFHLRVSMFKLERLRNLYRMCIDYAFRPRLSSRLTDRKSTRLNSSHLRASRMPSSA